MTMMKRTLSILMLSVAFGGLVGCSSAPKKERMEEPTTASTVEDMQELDEFPEASEAPAPTESATTMPSNDSLSLGAGSSGRGH